jgi:dUTPase
MWGKKEKKILFGMKNVILAYKIGYEDVICIYLVNTANETLRVHEGQRISCTDE